MPLDLTPPATVAAVARRGLALRAEFRRGGTAVGVARARDLAGGRTLSIDTVRRMASFFARHAVDLEAPAAKPGHPNYPSAGLIAWLLWGGDSGRAWAKKILKQEARLQEAGTKGYT